MCPDDYLTRRTRAWLLTPKRPHQWDDEHGRGRIGRLDLRPLHRVLKRNTVLNGSTRLVELLTGRYKRHQSMISSLGVKVADNPRYIKSCNYATLLEWTPLAPTEDQHFGGCGRPATTVDADRPSASLCTSGAR